MGCVLLKIKHSTVTKEEVKEQYNKFVGRKIFFIVFFSALIIIISGISTSLGSANISVWEAYSAILHKFFPNHFESSWLADVCVWNLRLPRILLGIVAGIGLGVAGAVMQAILRNPLASPYTLGISSGAGFGASLAIESACKPIYAWNLLRRRIRRIACDLSRCRHRRRGLSDHRQCIRICAAVFLYHPWIIKPQRRNT